MPVLIDDSSSGKNNGSNVELQKKISDKFNTQKLTDHYNTSKQDSLEEISSQHEISQDQSHYVRSRQNQQSYKNYRDQQFTSSRQQNSQNNTPNRPYDQNHQETVKSINYSLSSQHQPPSIHISQTVQSIQQSASRLMRPPLAKRKSTSRKKQSSIARTKFGKDSILQKPPLSAEKNVNSFVKDYSNDESDVVGKDPIKFDSHVYDSEYQQSIDQKDLQKRIEMLQNQQKMRISEPQISINPPVIGSSRSSVLKIQHEQSSKSIMMGSKLKSLQQARNLAKQSKKKSINLTQNENIFKYEQKMSQLQSFLSRKQQSIIKETKETKTIKLAIKNSPQQRKNIMNLLDELENQSSYKDDFQSYRQESQMAK